MSGASYRNAGAWLRQAESDMRTALALLARPRPMQVEDVGAHLAAACAQTLEKSLKGYVLLNRATPEMNHRPDKYLRLMLTRSWLRHPEHLPHLARLFDTSTKGTIRELFDLTPGGRGASMNTRNTEYPWLDHNEWQHTPWGDSSFANSHNQQRWCDTAMRVCNVLSKLREAHLQ